ncbi:MAG: methyltransferase, TIGR04325 family, partial [Sphaerospermopsis kisseleviana]
DYKSSLPDQIASYDYPVLFWFRKILDQNSSPPPTIFDFGGNVGTHYYTYSHFLDYSHELKWLVCDVPQIVKAGQELADERNVDLQFTTEFAEANAKQIFIASGSIQYVQSLSLSLLSKPPVHLLINRLPLYDGKSFVTLQNGGKVFYPQYVFNRKEFIDSLSELGDHTSIPAHRLHRLRSPSHFA